MNGEPEEENLNKSEISQVFEIALKRNLPVNFEVNPTFLFVYMNGHTYYTVCMTWPSILSSLTYRPTYNLSLIFKVLKEEGPPHMKSFVVRVTVGEFTGEGEGKSKKIAKKLAAAAVLGELKKLPHIHSVEKTLPRIKKKTKSINKVTRDVEEHSVLTSGLCSN